MTRSSKTLGALFLVMTLMAPVTATADKKAEAVALFKEGNRLRKADRFTEALEKYQAAYRLLPNFKINYNIALTLEKLGRNAKAAETYERFLAAGQGKSPAKMLRRARKKLKVLRKKIATVKVEVVGGAWVRVDGKGYGMTPLPWPLYLEPGRNRIDVVKAGHEPFTVELTLHRGQYKTLRVTLKAKAVKPEPPAPVPEEPAEVPKPPEEPRIAPPPIAREPAEPSATTPSEPPLDTSPVHVTVPDDADLDGEPQISQTRRGKTMWGYTGLGVGLAFAVTAVALYAAGNSQGAEAYDNYSSAVTQTEIDRHWEDVEAAETKLVAGHVLLSMGVAALGFSIYHFLTRPAARESMAGSSLPAEIRVTAGVSNGLWASWRF